ncbi:MAG: CRISPR-associated helicase Cas3' [Lachnospiraceae bacterium]|nr:CRISPR-associated helicase Cas3' [Lachnospiraceae bacterium]
MTAHISADGLDREESVAEHTKKTAYLCAEKGKRCGLPQVMTVCGILHDMGKNKQVFDNYIHADKNTRQKMRGTVAHASTGAKYLYDRYHTDNSNNVKILTELISYAVAAHHGLFDCVDIGHTDLFSKKVGEIADYDEACSNAGKDYLDETELDQIFAGASEEFHRTQDKIKGLYTRLKSVQQSKNTQNAKETMSNCWLFLFSCLQRLILSILIDSDWEATSDFMAHVDTFTKQADRNGKEIFGRAEENFAQYMQKKRQSVNTSLLSDKEKEILDARNALQKECREFAKHPAGIYCLPLPTGGGKTLSGLAYALEYCRQHIETERIIYVSPYISITEQNAKVFRDAIGEEKWILEHHSSVVRKEDKESEDYQTDQVSRYDINWEEPFICTTFVQFMNTLFSDKSESIRRMHRLVNSVVIIDEVQSMPLKCVHTFNYMINFLNTVCNTNIILCTATQPALEETEFPVCYSEPKYMIRDVDRWFRVFDRVKIHTPKALPGQRQKYTFESLGDEIAEQAGKFRSILVVLNTKSAVKKLYEILKSQNINARYLTTNLCAQHRSDRIEEIQKVLSSKKNIVVVSTNLIEAGVDISFECVYRSMTGLDSLAQSAGRCNRNGELEYGVIYLFMLDGENTGNMEELQQSRRVTEWIIHEYDQSDRADSLLMPRWMEAYYKKIYKYASDKMNFPIAKTDTNITELLSKGFGVEKKKNLMNPAYKTAGQAYRVIDDHSFGVIVPYGDGVEIIEDIQRTSDLSAIKTCIRQAQRYTVNVRENLLKSYDGLIQPVSDKIAGLYMVSAPGAYSMDYGIAPEWETLIF